MNLLLVTTAVAGQCVLAQDTLAFRLPALHRALQLGHPELHIFDLNAFDERFITHAAARTYTEAGVPWSSYTSATWVGTNSKASYQSARESPSQPFKPARMPAFALPYTVV
jgi:hypothetical protein